MLFQRQGPDETVRRDVASLGRVNALKPRLVLAPPDVAAAGDIDAITMEDRHSVKIARALAAVGVVFVHLGFRRGRIEIELPYLLQFQDLTRRWIVAQRFKCIHDTVAAAEKNQRTAIHLAQRWRRPSAVKNIRR